MRGGELKGLALGEPVTEVGCHGEMSDGNGYANIEGYPLGEKLCG